MRIGLAQLGYPTTCDVLGQVSDVAAQAEEAGCDLVVFPENLMAPRPLSESEIVGLAEPMGGTFVCGLEDIAREHGLWMVATTYEATDSRPPYNTAVVIDDGGRCVLRYRKCHLYDAHGVFESRRYSAGDALPEPVRTPFVTLGVGICYDLRFCELSRHLALGGAELIVYPAAWQAGPGKERHWSCLLGARAIENECFVAGVCHSSDANVGTCHLFDPLGAEVAGGEGEGLFVADIDVARVAQARDAMPILSHRRQDLY